MSVNLLEGFRPICPGDFILLQNLYSSVSGPPRFWRATSYLAANSANLIGQRRGCTILVRRKVLHGHPVVYLLVPPMGPIGVAKDVLHEYLDAGIGAKVTVHDVHLYDAPVISHTTNKEFVYRGGLPVPAGAAGKDLRYGLNRLTRLRAEGHLTLISSNTIDAKTLYGCVDLAKRWYRQRRGVTGTDKIIASWAAAPRSDWQFIHCLCNAQGNVVALSLTERIGFRQTAIIVRIRDFEDPLSTGMIGALHALDCAAFDGDLTIGSAVGVAGLGKHKDSLGATNVVQIHDAVTSHKLTMDEYRQHSPTQGLLSGAL